MPQWDRHKKRVVNIEFVAVEELKLLPYPERSTLVFITSGSLKGMLNQRPIAINAPGILCLAEDDQMQIMEKYDVSAQSFSFHAEFLNTIRQTETEAHFPSAPRIQTGLSLFERGRTHHGVPRITEKAYPLLLEWFFIMGTEEPSQLLAGLLFGPKWRVKHADALGIESIRRSGRYEKNKIGWSIPEALLL